ncbi:LuxR C-terminal-related transcriptional regulator [Thalassospira mesophila]|uniref:LuxR C-terminal-related transcriptional regulator n=1 Tax=Thalassospira mesophila TaxID=1293891 RepID=UPI000A1FB7F2|nr:response regulator transcription factor [Thalassospira mesophila]
MKSIEQDATQHVAVVHPGSLMRHALTTILGEFRNLSITSVPSLEELREDIDNDTPTDIVLVSIDDVQQDIANLTMLRDHNPALKILALSHHYELEDLFALFKINIDGALLDDVSQNTLKLAFRMLKEGQKLFPSNLAQVLMARIDNPCMPFPTDIPDDEVDLTHREQEILQCLENGESNKRIAIRLDITEATVKVHVKSILRKIGVDNRTQAAIWSLRQRTRPMTHKYFPAAPCAVPRCLHPSA